MRQYNRYPPEVGVAWAVLFSLLAWVFLLVLGWWLLG